MRPIQLACCFFLLPMLVFGQTLDLSGLDPAPYEMPIFQEDWLVKNPDLSVKIYREGEKDIVLTNGLLLRRWRVSPNLACTHVTLLKTGENFVRGVKPEAMLVLDGETVWVGGLNGQQQYGYLLPAWLDSMTADSGAFRVVGFETGDVEPLLEWKQARWAGEKTYPAKGKRLSFVFRHPSEQWRGVEVLVHYEMYEGMPVVSKWITVRSEGRPELRMDTFASEILAVREEEVSVENGEALATPNILVQTDYSFGDMSSRFSSQTVRWVPDETYASQVNYLKKTPCLLLAVPPVGPDVTIPPGDAFTSFRTWELFHDSHDRERKGLAERRFYRKIAPWATENPIFMHVTSTDPVVVKAAIDQCAEVGFEMVILSFGSGLNMEDSSPENIQTFRELADYAHSKGIQLGGYSLFSSRQISPEHDCINPETGQPGGTKFGNAPCLCSEWGIRYLDHLKKFITATGFDLLEHDGPYPGDVCASTAHPGHEGYADSQWQQWDSTVEFYKWLREKGVYLNAPDWYFLNGSNKVGIGYRETNWSLPRAQQVLLGRQNIYDGTWTKTPSMGWTFTPLVEYHGGGPAATIEPLSEHLADYKAHLWQNFGAGVQSCYRGPRLFDTEEVKFAVQSVVNWYKNYRSILNSDLVHLRRADGQDWDGFLHVNPQLQEKGLAMLFNPLGEPIRRKIKLPLYYTGLTESANIRTGRSDGSPSLESLPQTYPLDRFFNVEIEVEIPANGWVWLVVEG